jgi:hypothetical protein
VGFRLATAVKRDDETWDEFLLRVVSETGEGMSPGTLSEAEAEDAMQIVRDGLERYCFSTPLQSSPISGARTVLSSISMTAGRGTPRQSASSNISMAGLAAVKLMC